MSEFNKVAPADEHDEDEPGDPAFGLPGKKMLEKQDKDHKGDDRKADEHKDEQKAPEPKPAPKPEDRK